MSFSSEVKKEISGSSPEKSCCVLAELAGLLRSVGTVRPEGSGGLGIGLSTSYPFIARHMKALLTEATGQNATVYTSKAPGRYTKNRYEVRLGASQVLTELLREAGILSENEGFFSLATDIPPALTATKCCRKSLVKGFFLGAGSVTDPAKGYHLEIALKDRDLSLELRRVVAGFRDIKAQLAARETGFVLYIKKSEAVRDMLGIMGAHAALLRFEDARMMKELRGRANRLSNLDSANIGRQIASLERQTAAAERLLEMNERERLRAEPEQLSIVIEPREADGDVKVDSRRERSLNTARLRLLHPEAGLAELAELFEPPVSKTEAHRRLKEMEAAAEGYTRRSRPDEPRGFHRDS